MKLLILSVFLGISLFGSSLQLQSGSVSALTGVLGDGKIDPINRSLNTNLSIDEDDISSLVGTISVKMSMFKSDNEDRDVNMYETLEVEKFAHSTYTIKSVEATDAKDRYTLKGELDLHGVKNPLDFDAIIAQDADTLSIDAKTKINVENYNIDMPCLLGFTMCVDENVNIDANVVLNKN